MSPSLRLLNLSLKNRSSSLFAFCLQQWRTSEIQNSEGEVCNDNNNVDDHDHGSCVIDNDNDNQ